MTANTDSKILKRLSELEKEEGSLPLLLQFYRKLLLVQTEARKQIGTPEVGLSGKAVYERIQQGFPLLSFDDFNIDLVLAQDVFVKVTDVFSSHPELFGEIAEKLREATAGRILTREAIKAWFTGEKLPPEMLDGISENLMQAIIQFTLKPFLTAYAEKLITCVEQEQWRRRYCPVCGGSPDLAFLDKERGTRWLLCSRCDAEWLFQRLECPYCGNQDQQTLSFFTDDEGLYRLYVCERCKCYLKAIDLRKTESEILLPLERLYTLDIDAQAKEYGYKPYQKPVPNKR